MSAKTTDIFEWYKNRKQFCSEFADSLQDFANSDVKQEEKVSRRKSVDDAQRAATSFFVDVSFRFMKIGLSVDFRNLRFS